MTPELLSLSTNVHSDHTVVSVRGEVDAYSAGQLRTHLLSVLRDEPPAHLVVDLGAVDFMDSTGLGVLVGAHSRLGANGTLHVVCGPGAHPQDLPDHRPGPAAPALRLSR